MCTCVRVCVCACGGMCVCACVVMEDTHNEDVLSQQVNNNNNIKISIF